MSRTRDAEETKDWDRFWGSGKVDDYLRYKNCPGKDRESPGAGTGKNRKPIDEAAGRCT